MYVVKRPFKSIGKIYTAGTVIAEPAKIKRFNGKLAEGKIIKVDEQNIGSTAEYFKTKYGVDITPSKKPADAAKKETTSKTVLPQKAAIPLLV